MAFEAGNRFWEIRSKHGKDKLFASPELMWEAAVEYFAWCDANPLIEIDFRGKDAQEVQIPKMRPYTMQGLCGYMGCSVSYFREFKRTQKGIAFDYLTVIARIEDVVYNQKFSGAASGFLNPNIIARDLGLADKTESKVHTSVTAVDYSKLSDEALEEIINATRSNEGESGEGA